MPEHEKINDVISLGSISEPQTVSETSNSPPAMIRAYRDEDLEDLLEVWYRASLVGHPFLDDAFLHMERRAIAEVYIPAAETWVYVLEGCVVGFIALLGREVGAIFVDPAVHGQGIGGALMDYAAALHDELELDVFEANAVGRRFYARYGFRPIRKYVHEATGLPLLRLRWSAD